MKQINFDQIIDRSKSGAICYDGLQQYFGRKDLLPLWIADMDFATPSFIIDALRKRLEHPILGYTQEPEAYRQAIIDWVASHHQWKIERDWIRYIPGIVRGIGTVVNAMTCPDDEIVIMTPVYHPFRLVPEGNGRTVVQCPLNTDGEMPTIDFDKLASVCNDRTRLLIFCNPHNPIGICWDRETLIRLADFCHERNLLVISDEIHCDMALFGHKHIPFASVSQKAADISITFQAPTKTFNIAGVVSSHTIVPNEKIREKYFGWLEANEFDFPHLFAPIATIAAFSKEGEEWRQQMLHYVEDNIRFVEDYCREQLPQLHPVRPQSSFLVWLDCRGLGLNHDGLFDLVVNRAHIALNDGAMFGKEGTGCMRLNVGMPRAIIRQALDQLRQAVGG